MKRIHTALAVAMICLTATVACNRHKKKYTPGPPPLYKGSYIQSCRDITTLAGGFFSAACADSHGQFQVSYLQGASCHGDIGNNDGLLVCNGATATKTEPKLVTETALSGDAAPGVPAPAVAPAK